MTVPTFYSGECQFVTFADSSKGGPRITLRLHDRAELEPFIGMEGKRFAMVLVQIGDDEQPVQQAAKADAVPKGGELAKLAGQWCSRSDFCDFIRPIYCRLMGGDGSSWGDVTPDDFRNGKHGYCRHAILVICDVDSRAELDHDYDAAAKFNDVIRRPFMSWLKVPA